MPYLQQAFQGASDAYNKAAGVGGPSDFTARYSPAAMDLFRQQLGYGANTGVANNTGALGNTFGNMGANAASTGLNGLANFTPQGGTQFNIDAAGQYANNPAIQGMVDASMRDANQQYNDVTSPGITRNAAGTGNINSTSPSIERGIVERGLAQKAADISSTLRGNSWSQGLNLAQNQSNNNNQSILASLMGAANGGTNAANTGINANNSYVNQLAGLFNIGNTGAQNEQAGNQADLTNQMQQWNFGTNSPFAALNNFYNIIGNRQWGSQTQGSGSSQTTNNPSTLSMIGGGLGMLGSFF